MSVNELQARAQQFANAFDQHDLQPVLNMLSEDVEVFDHVPYRFDGKPLVAKYLSDAVEGIVSANRECLLKENPNVRISRLYTNQDS